MFSLIVATGCGGRNQVSPVPPAEDASAQQAKVEAPLHRQSSVDQPPPPVEQPPPPTPSEVSELKRVVISDIQWNRRTGESGLVNFDIPRGAISFSIFLHSDDSRAFFLVDTLIDPFGKAFVSKSPTGRGVPRPLPQFFGAGQHFSPNRTSLDMESGGYAGLLVPNSPGLVLSPGRWTLKVAAVDKNLKPSPVEPKIVLLIKSKPGGKISAKTRGRLKINLQFTGSDGLKVSTAKTRKFLDLQAQLKSLALIYSKIGIEVVQVGAQDIDFPEKIPVSGKESASRLFQMGKITDGINLIFVEDIQLESDPWQRMDAMAGGIPGPQSMVGAFQNGVLISTKRPDPLIRKAPLGVTMAHEIGHFLGLPHVADPEELIEDSFPDTRLEAENLMEAGLDRDVSVITPQQRALILLSPAVTLLE